MLRRPEHMVQKRVAAGLVQHFRFAAIFMRVPRPAAIMTTVTFLFIAIFSLRCSACFLRLEGPRTAAKSITTSANAAGSCRIFARYRGIA